MTDEMFEKGLQIRREVLGTQYTEPLWPRRTTSLATSNGS